jgi:hypothetical protein
LGAATLLSESTVRALAFHHSQPIPLNISCLVFPPQVLAYHEKKYKVFRRMTDDQLEYRRIME